MNQSRFYLDYNASSPLGESVKQWLISGDYDFANPSSVHTRGKKAKREMEKVKDFLFETFGLDDQEFKIFFHSGATEGINTILKSFSDKTFYYHGTDHSCVGNIKDSFSKSVNFDFNDLSQIKNEGILNWTWVNNETGAVRPLHDIAKIKEKNPELIVHVDGVQAVGKIADWQKLSPLIDAYTFSGHKFGALKGIGFSFIRSSLELSPIIIGGGQQLGMRSGTENIIGIASLKYALEDILKNYDFIKQSEAKRWFEEKLSQLIGEYGEVVCASEPHRNGNTIYFILYNTLAQTTAMALDMAGFDVSNGSACSSGAVIPSRVLKSIGYSDTHAKSAIRLSFSPYIKIEEAELMWVKFEKIIKKFI